MVSGNIPPVVCGIGDYTARLSDELRCLGIPVTIWSRAQSGALETETVRLPVARLDRTGVATLATRIVAERPEVLHLQYEADAYDNNGWALLQFALAARKAHASLVTTFHALDGPRTWGRAHRLALTAGLIGSRDIVVCSRRQYDALSRLPGIGAKTHLIPVGSTVPIKGKRSPRHAGEPLRLVYFGFVWRGRNLETCVRALAAVSERFPATLAIVGGIKEEPYRREVEEYARMLGVADRVTFHGDVPAPALSQLLVDADIALLPFATGVSTGRSTFAAVIEHGLPTVTMVTPGNLTPEFRHGANLLSVAPSDADGFVRQTVRLATDAALREVLRANAPSLARLFSWQEIARQTANLPSYREVLGIGF